MSHASHEQVATTAAQLWAQAHAGHEFDSEKFGAAVMDVYIAAMKFFDEEGGVIYQKKIAATIEAGRQAGLSLSTYVGATEVAASTSAVVPEGVDIPQR